jgi:hypothetical protein
MLNEDADLSEINDNGPKAVLQMSGDTGDRPLSLRLNNLTCEIPVSSESATDNSNFDTIGTHTCIENESKGMEW